MPGLKHGRLFHFPTSSVPLASDYKHFSLNSLAHSKFTRKPGTGAMTYYVTWGHSRIFLGSELHIMLVPQNMPAMGPACLLRFKGHHGTSKFPYELLKPRFIGSWSPLVRSILHMPSFAFLVTLLKHVSTLPTPSRSGHFTPVAPTGWPKEMSPPPGNAKFWWFVALIWWWAAWIRTLILKVSFIHAATLGS